MHGRDPRRQLVSCFLPSHPIPGDMHFSSFLPLHPTFKFFFVAVSLFEWEMFALFLQRKASHICFKNWQYLKGHSWPISGKWKQRNYGARLWRRAWQSIAKETTGPGKICVHYAGATEWQNERKDRSANDCRNHEIKWVKLDISKGKQRNEPFTCPNWVVLF